MYDNSERPITHDYIPGEIKDPSRLKTLSGIIAISIIIICIVFALFSCTKPDQQRPKPQPQTYCNIYLNDKTLPITMDSVIVYKDSISIWVYGKNDSINYSFHFKARTTHVLEVNATIGGITYSGQLTVYDNWSIGDGIVNYSSSNEIGLAKVILSHNGNLGDHPSVSFEIGLPFTKRY